MEKYEIIKNFEDAEACNPLPDIPIDKMEANDAIMVEEEGTQVLYMRWQNRLNRYCKKHKLKRSDFKITIKGNKTHIVRVYVSQLEP